MVVWSLMSVVCCMFVFVCLFVRQRFLFLLVDSLKKSDRLLLLFFLVRFNSISWRTSKNSIWRAMKTFKCKERTQERKEENEWNQVLVKYNVRFIDFFFDILDKPVQFPLLFIQWLTEFEHEHICMMKVPLRVSCTFKKPSIYL